MMNTKKSMRVALPLLMLAGIVGCSDSDPVTQMYEVTVTNLSNSQPLSPLAVALHSQTYSGWRVGESVGTGLEQLAEGGDNSMFLTDAVTEGAIATFSGAGVVTPGAAERIDVSVNSSTDLRLTVATMLVNTNDAFAGKGGIDLNALALGEQITMTLPVYDAGTEGNSERAGTIPGPADGGEGFNATRDDVNIVSRHSGVVTDIDGYADSVLDESHRFDAPVAQLVVRRVN